MLTYSRVGARDNLVRYEVTRSSNLYDIKILSPTIFVYKIRPETSYLKEVYCCLSVDLTHLFHRTIGQSLAQFPRFSVDHFHGSLFRLPNKAIEKWLPEPWTVLDHYLSVVEASMVAK